MSVLSGTGTLPAAGASALFAASRQAGSAWLDQALKGPSEALHIGPNSQHRAIDEIEQEFKRALCLAEPASQR
jgi:hypothetical protein